MKIGLIAYNWEADTSLALWNLITYARKEPTIASNVIFQQYCAATPKSINSEEDELFSLLKWVRDGQFSLVGFSCYIWNIKFVNRVAQAIKELWPEILIIYGGQQIRGFYVEQVFERERCVDICVINEAELTFQKLLLNLLTEKPLLSTIGGLAYWAKDSDQNSLLKFGSKGGVVPPGYSFHQTGAPQIIEDLNDIPSPYLGGEDLPVGGAFLYEASRGCPYQCSFCIWGEAKGVREYSMERVEAELCNILSHHPSHIMFCDGTFNMRKDRAAAILEILVDHLQQDRVQPFSLLLELKLEIIDHNLAEIIDKLVRLNPLVTIEFGLQSASQEAAKLMRRPFREDRFREAWDRLTPKLKSSAILDCIYGLPGDGIEQFKKTVDFCYSLAPHRIQCFRLSILPGSEFERQAEQFEIKYAREPNHMVYATAWLDLDEMTWLETFGYAVADLYHFHGATIKCILGLPSCNEIKFSELINKFVMRSGRGDIVKSSYGGNRPEGRWRAIDLTYLFQQFVFEVMLPEAGVFDSKLLSRFKDLFHYELTLGKIAVQGLETVHSAWPQDRIQGSSKLAVRAEVIQTNYDISTFIIGARGKTRVNVSDLVEKDTYIALTQKAGHQDVRIPISYRISKQIATILHDLRDQLDVDKQSRLHINVDTLKMLHRSGLVISIP